MSVYFTGPIWKNSKRAGTELLALLALADMANDDGVCWPSALKIGQRIRRSEKQARRILREFVATNEITIIELGGGTGKSNHYRINLDVIGTLPLVGGLGKPEPSQNGTANPPKGDPIPPIAMGEETSLETSVETLNTGRVLEPEIEFHNNGPTLQGLGISAILWDEWLAYRKNEIKQPIGPIQERKLLKRLAGLKSRGHDPSELIETTMSNGWRGIFEPNDKSNFGGKAVTGYAPLADDISVNTNNEGPHDPRGIR